MKKMLNCRAGALHSRPAPELIGNPQQLGKLQHCIFKPNSNAEPVAFRKFPRMTQQPFRKIIGPFDNQHFVMRHGEKIDNGQWTVDSGQWTKDISRPTLLKKNLFQSFRWSDFQSFRKIKKTGPNHPKTNIAEPVVHRMIDVPEGATQIIRIVEPGTAAHRAGGFPKLI